MGVSTAHANQDTMDQTAQVYIVRHYLVNAVNGIYPFRPNF